jgi:hypothetical protein
MMKLIIQKTNNQKTPGTAITKSSVCLVNVLELFLWCPVLVLMLGFLGFLGKGAAPFVRQLGVETAGRFFLSLFFWFFPLSLV